MNIAASKDIRRILKTYMKAPMYIYPIGIVKVWNATFPLKALNKSRNASKNETCWYLSSLLNILPKRRKSPMIKPKVAKNLTSSLII